MTNSLWLALAAGAVRPLQALINFRLAGSLGGALLAASVSFLVAAMTLLLVQLALRMPVPGAAQMASVPAWTWFGGMLGPVYVAGAIVSVGAMGPTSAICLIIAGQIGAALLIDQFGILGAAGHPVTLPRLFGAGLTASAIPNCWPSPMTSTPR